MTTPYTLGIPNGCLRYEVRGTGSLLLVMGAPVAASRLAPLADALARDFMVVTYDQPGISCGAANDVGLEMSPELTAEDAATLLDELGAESADVFGSGDGALAGLAMVERHPGRIRTLIAHQPPFSGLVPGAAMLRAEIDDIVRTLHREGPAAAWRKFVISSSFHGARTLSASGSTHVVVGVGIDSDGLSAHSSMALAESLDKIPVGFPGDLTGFLERPDDFAKVLRRVLTNPVCADAQHTS